MPFLINFVIVQEQIFFTIEKTRLNIKLILRLSQLVLLRILQFFAIII